MVSNIWFLKFQVLYSIIDSLVLNLGLDFHIQEISQQEKFSNLHKSSLNSSKLAIGTQEKSNID